MNKDWDFFKLSFPFQTQDFFLLFGSLIKVGFVRESFFFKAVLRERGFQPEFIILDTP
jgi:hypothetical protein